MLPFWLVFWAQCSLLLKHEILKKLVTFMYCICTAKTFFIFFDTNSKMPSYACLISWRTIQRDLKNKIESSQQLFAPFSKYFRNPITLGHIMFCIEKTRERKDREKEREGGEGEREISWIPSTFKVYGSMNLPAEIHQTLKS